jgi:hypothetical protein
MPHPHKWLPFALLTTLAVAIWALAAAHDHAWELVWLPAVIAGAAWPTRERKSVQRCIRRLRRDRNGEP